ncbi:MAG: ricin B lectin domain-containing protein [Linnemannia elongata]|nr:MAG: ricin B lectin domain-containing protein [Linnemannia elongata]
MSFPHGPFQIQLRDENLVLDVKEGGVNPGAEIIVWPSRRDAVDNDNQKWVYENGQIKNVKSGLVLTAGGFNHGVNVAQFPGQESNEQRYDYYDYTISAKEDEDLVIGVTSKSEGSSVSLVRRDNDDFKQMWEIVAL